MFVVYSTLQQINNSTIFNAQLPPLPHDSDRGGDEIKLATILIQQYSIRVHSHNSRTTELTKQPINNHHNPRNLWTKTNQAVNHLDTNLTQWKNTI
jgi:hypothetical protein